MDCRRSLDAASLTAHAQTYDLDILIRDPLGIDLPGGAFAFTDTTGGSNTLAFFDTYGGAPGQSSYVYQLAFSLNGPLGGPAANIGLSDIYFAMDGDPPRGVPEPGTFALLALALAGLGIARDAKGKLNLRT